jgi:acylphosphatase
VILFFFAPDRLRCSIVAVKTADIVRMRLVVSGMVQGVGFRYATVDQGRRLGLGGWARNTRDGRVEIVAEGPAEKVETLALWCESGPPSARVTSVERELLPAGGERLEGFGVRY